MHDDWIDPYTARITAFEHLGRRRERRSRRLRERLASARAAVPRRRGGPRLGHRVGRSVTET